MQESSLHAALKNWYAKTDGKKEVPVNGYMIDVVIGNILIEIQTGNFSALKEKLRVLLASNLVLLVHPIALGKRIIKLPKSGKQPISRRKSPKKGRIEDVFLELIHIGYLVPHPNLQVEVVFTREEEIRRDDGKGSWRRRGVSIKDRRLVEVLGTQPLRYPEDYISLIPPDLERPFTNRSLANALKIRLALARKMTYCLRSMDVLTISGKRGNAHLYQVNQMNN